MPVKFLFKLLFAVSSLVLLSFASMAQAPPDEAAKMLPDRVGNFRASGTVRPLVDKSKPDKPKEVYNALSSAAREYISPKGESLTVHLIKTSSDSGAYALLTSGNPKTYTSINGVTSELQEAKASQAVKIEGLGTAAFSAPGQVMFFKGTTFVEIFKTNPPFKDNEDAISLARLLADTFDRGDGDIPVLVKHLPEWETASERARYAVTATGLREAVGGGSTWLALDEVNFDGGTEAVTTTYGASRLVLVEYTTPQLATDSDARITALIKELSDKGESVPSAYRRVGNYSVFVFNAPDQEAAKQLIDSVSYEQVVQWLGDNPRVLERMQRIYTETTAGIILAVIKASGLAVLLCLGVGGIFGALIFRHRRAQQAATAAYSDAGDMIRLNIDNLTPQSSPARLLGRGDG